MQDITSLPTSNQSYDPREQPWPLEVEVDGKVVNSYPIEFKLNIPRDQTEDMCRHIEYAASLGLPRLSDVGERKSGKCIVVGGAPSAAKYLEEIRALAVDPNNAVFACNWAHTWLIRHGIIPHGCLMFEIDADPCQILGNTHPDVTYYVCSHCHTTTFDGLKDNKVIVWQAPPETKRAAELQNKHFANDLLIFGGVTTFMRTLSVALALGWNDFHLFGVDSSFPAESKTTHFEGYPSDVTMADAMDVWAVVQKTGAKRHFKTVGYLAQQVDHFQDFCNRNHSLFKMRVYGDGLLRFVHEGCHPEQYTEDAA